MYTYGHLSTSAFAPHNMLLCPIHGRNWSYNSRTLSNCHTLSHSHAPSPPHPLTHPPPHPLASSPTATRTRAPFFAPHDPGKGHTYYMSILLAKYAACIAAGTSLYHLHSCFKLSDIIEGGNALEDESWWQGKVMLAALSLVLQKIPGSFLNWLFRLERSRRRAIAMGLKPATCVPIIGLCKIRRAFTVVPWVTFVILTAACFALTIVLTSTGFLQSPSVGSGFDDDGTHCQCAGITAGKDVEADWISLLLLIVVSRAFMFRPSMILVGTLVFLFPKWRQQRIEAMRGEQQGGNNGGDVGGGAGRGGEVEGGQVRGLSVSTSVGGGIQRAIQREQRDTGDEEDLAVTAGQLKTNPMFDHTHHEGPPRASSVRKEGKEGKEGKDGKQGGQSTRDGSNMALYCRPQKHTSKRHASTGHQPAAVKRVEAKEQQDGIVDKAVENDHSAPIRLWRTTTSAVAVAMPVVISHPTATITQLPLSIGESESSNAGEDAREQRHAEKVIARREKSMKGKRQSMKKNISWSPTGAPITTKSARATVGGTPYAGAMMNVPHEDARSKSARATFGGTPHAGGAPGAASGSDNGGDGDGGASGAARDHDDKLAVDYARSARTDSMEI